MRQDLNLKMDHESAEVVKLKRQGLSSFGRSISHSIVALFNDSSSYRRLRDYIISSGNFETSIFSVSKILEGLKSMSMGRYRRDLSIDAPLRVTRSVVLDTIEIEKCYHRGDTSRSMATTLVGTFSVFVCLNVLKTPAVLRVLQIAVYVRGSLSHFRYALLSLRELWVSPVIVESCPGYFHTPERTRAPHTPLVAFNFSHQAQSSPTTVGLVRPLSTRHVPHVPYAAYPKRETTRSCALAIVRRTHTRYPTGGTLIW